MNLKKRKRKTYHFLLNSNSCWMILVNYESRFFFSFSSIGHWSCWMNEKRKMILLFLSFSFSTNTHVPIDGQQYRCEFREITIVKTKKNEKKTELFILLLLLIKNHCGILFIYNHNNESWARQDEEFHSHLLYLNRSNHCTLTLNFHRQTWCMLFSLLLLLLA